MGQEEFAADAAMVDLRLAVFIEQSVDAMACCTAGGVVRFWNRAAERLFGYRAADMTGASILQLIPSAVREQTGQHLRNVMHAGRARRCRPLCLRRDGSALELSASVTPMPRAADGAGLMVITFVRARPRRKGKDRMQLVADAELRRLNAELELRIAQRSAEFERVSQELESFSYSVSHDLRAPLRVIGGFSKLVLSGAPVGLDESTLKNLRRIADGVRQMEGLIHDLLDLARVSRAEMPRQDLDLTAMVEFELGVLRDAQPDRHVETLVQRGMRANADAGLFRILLRNLLGNAWKFSANAGSPRIEIGIAAWEGGDAYFVRDNGVGFDMRYAGKLFAPFQRLHSREEFEGSGIGLSIVQRIVTRHAGRIWTDARRGEGATFYFTLG